MDCPPGHKKVAVVERWPLVEVRLYYVKNGHAYLLSVLSPQYLTANKKYNGSFYSTDIPAKGKRY